MKKKYDKILITILTVVIIALFLFQYLTGTNGDYAVITQDGITIGQYRLSGNQTFTVTTEDGHSNTLTIKDGQIWVSQADCPDQLCMKQGHISRAGQSIICLPHKLTVLISARAEQDVDTIVQ